jgi:phosphoribosylformylglycinamidine synthase I
MAQPNVLILRAPGTNCDQETAFAFSQAGAKTELIHVNRLLESPDIFSKFQALCIPGGFSYGDDVAAGRILGNQIQHHLAQHLIEFKAAEKLILGICNGFQVLLKSGILIEPNSQGGPAATLTWNDSGKFEDRWVRLRVSGSKSVFFDGIESIYLPVAHAEGKFVASGEEQLRQLDAAGQLVLRYRPLAENDDSSENAVVPYPDNPNGSVADVAGICDSTGRVLGLMPHPERHIDRTHHPRWTRGEGSEIGDGMRIFANAVAFLK